MTILLFLVCNLFIGNMIVSKLGKKCLAIKLLRNPFACDKSTW